MRKIKYSIITAILVGLFASLQLLADTRIWCKSGTQWVQIGSLANRGDGDTYFDNCDDAYRYMHNLPPATPRPRTATPAPSTPRPTYQPPSYLYLPPIPLPL